MALCHLPTVSCNSNKHHPTFFTSEPHSFPTFNFLTISSPQKKPRTTEQLKATSHAKSNADLCNELREFNLIAGFPADHVPLMRELQQHGRKDLANIVRRRGYKKIAELLNAKAEEINIGRNSVKNQSPDRSFGNDSSDIQTAENLDSPASSSPNNKVTDFVQQGDKKNGKGLIEIEDMWVHAASDVGFDGVLETRGVDVKKTFAELDEDKRVESTGPSQANLASDTFGSKVSLPVEETTSCRDNGVPSEDLNSVEFDKEVVDMAGENDDLIEIDRLKAVLHEKEMELSQLKQQIEKEKFALSDLQTKATTEIGDAQRAILTKDAEFLAIEERLSGLKEVLIEYKGAGEIVEVAGSFNGWQYPIQMDPSPSDEMIEQTGSRNVVLWSTVLWLYPGTYEIKFIVDGHWRIDPQQEFTTRGHIQNNILKVER